MTQARGSTGTQVTRVGPAPRQVWRELIAVDPDALPTQSP